MSQSLASEQSRDTILTFFGFHLGLFNLRFKTLESKSIDSIELIIVLANNIVFGLTGSSSNLTGGVVL